MLPHGGAEGKADALVGVIIFVDLLCCMLLRLIKDEGQASASQFQR